MKPTSTLPTLKPTSMYKDHKSTSTDLDHKPTSTSMVHQSTMEPHQTLETITTKYHNWYPMDHNN